MPYSARLLSRCGLAACRFSLSAGCPAVAPAAALLHSAPQITVSRLRSLVHAPQRNHAVHSNRLRHYEQVGLLAGERSDRWLGWRTAPSPPAGLYTAPATMPTAQAVTVTAVSAASASASGSAYGKPLQPHPDARPLLPERRSAARSATLIDVTGTGFVPTSAIQAAGVAQATTYVSATELTATVTVSSGTTNLNITVDNPAPGATNSSTLNIPLTYFSTTATAAARLLDQTSFGPTPASIQHVQTHRDGCLPDRTVCHTDNQHGGDPHQPAACRLPQRQQSLRLRGVSVVDNGYHRPGPASPARRLRSLGDVRRLHAIHCRASQFLRITTRWLTTPSATSPPSCMTSPFLRPWALI